MATKNQPKKQPKTKGHVPKTAAFLAAYVRTASVTKAARAAKVHKSLHYQWLKDDAEYAAAFAEAQDQAAQILEDEAIRRAHEGYDEPVIYQGEQCYQREDIVDPETGEITGSRVNLDKPLVIRKYSDSLLTFLLKGFRPNKYRENIKAEVTGNVDIAGLLAAARSRLNSDQAEQSGS